MSPSGNLLNYINNLTNVKAEKEIREGTSISLPFFLIDLFILNKNKSFSIYMTCRTYVTDNYFINILKKKFGEIKGLRIL